MAENDPDTVRDLLLAELRIAHMRANSAQLEIAFLGKALSKNILTIEEVLIALEENCGWRGFLEPHLMEKIRQAYGADVG